MAAKKKPKNPNWPMYKVMRPTYVLHAEEFLGKNPTFLPLKNPLIALLKQDDKIAEKELKTLCAQGESALKGAIRRQELTYDGVFQTEPGGTLETKFLWAAKYGKTERIHQFIKEGVDIHADNDAALCWAANEGHTETVALLLQYGTDIQANDDIALRRAAGNGRTETIIFLLRNGADIHALNDSALRWAAKNGHTETAQILRDHLDGKTLPPAEKFRKEPPKPETTSPVVPTTPVGQWLQKENAYTPQYEKLLLDTFETPERVLRYLKGAWTRGEIDLNNSQPLHDLAQFQWPKNHNWNRRKWADFAIKYGTAGAQYFRLADKLGDPTTPKALAAKAALLTYDRAKENPVLARLCHSLNVDEKTFEKALEMTPKAAKTSLLPDVTIEHNGLRLTRLPPGDIRGLFLGEFTHCCQHLGGVGAECAVYGFTRKESGFYIVQNANDEIVGQTWATLTKKGLLLDSLETLGNRVSKKDWKILIGKLRDAAGVSLHIGTGGGTGTLGIPTSEQPIRHPRYQGYSDASNQYRLEYRPTPARLEKASENRRTKLGLM
jgi:hypothetical protein